MVYIGILARMCYLGKSVLEVFPVEIGHMGVFREFVIIISISESHYGVYILIRIKEIDYFSLPHA